MAPGYDGEAVEARGKEPVGKGGDVGDGAGDTEEQVSSSSDGSESSSSSAARRR